MDAYSCLTVQVEVDALVVNESVERQLFHRWFLDYTKLSVYDSPEPPVSSPSNNWPFGIYLKWTLPNGLRHASPDQPESEPKFPCVPNRWLVIRSYQDSSTTPQTIDKSWVIESDFLSKTRVEGSAENNFSDNLHSPTFPNPHDVSIAMYIGRNILLNHGIEIPKGVEYLSELTAISNGDINFSAFQPYNQNVFSFYDDIRDVPAHVKVNYCVVGWYSNHAQNPLANCTPENLEATLNRYSWKPEVLTILYKDVICYGNCSGVDYSFSTILQNHNIVPDNVSITVGPTPLEAITTRMASEMNHSEDEELKEAIQTLSHHLEEIDRDDIKTVLIDQKHNDSFGKKTGGFYWEIVSKEEHPKTDTSLLMNALPVPIKENLNEINTIQKQLEKKQQLLLKEQWDLYADWWKQGRYRVYQEVLSHFHWESKRASKIINITAIKKDIKKNEDRLNQKINDITAELRHQNLELKKLSRSPFCFPKDPVILITGLKPETQEENFNTPTERTTIALSENILLHPYFKNTALLNEIQKLAYPLQNWEQPWLPLFLEWKIKWFDFENWSFQEGQYQLKEITDEERFSVAQIFEGRSLLMPSASSTLKGQIKNLLEHDSTLTDSDREKHLKIINNKINSWNVLTFNLSGLAQALIQRDSRMNRMPNMNAEGEIAELINTQGHNPPRPDSDFDFHSILQGRFYLEDLHVIDRFGQSAYLIQDGDFPGLSSKPEDCKPVIAECMKPNKVINSLKIFPFIPEETFVQINPRIIQPIRLDVDWVSSTNERLLTQCDANPIIGWLLPDYVDKSFEIFNQNGKKWGELYLKGTDLKFEKYESNNQNQYLDSFLMSLENKDAFNTLREIITKALDKKRSSDSHHLSYTSALIGRPLVLARAQWHLELEQPEYTDQRWDASNPSSTIYHPFPLQLGNPSLNSDGLVGYFCSPTNKKTEKENFDIFYSFYSEANDTYSSIATLDNFCLQPFYEENPRYTTLLFDPFKKIHAYTGILPVTTFQLPDRFIKPALDNMEVSFRLGPLLTLRTISNQPESKPSEIFDLIMPEIKSEWKWLENYPGVKNIITLQTPSLSTAFADRSTELVEGFVGFRFSDKPIADTQLFNPVFAPTAEPVVSSVHTSERTPHLTSNLQEENMTMSYSEKSDPAAGTRTIPVPPSSLLLSSSQLQLHPGLSNSSKEGGQTYRELKEKMEEALHQHLEKISLEDEFSKEGSYYKVRRDWEKHISKADSAVTYAGYSAAGITSFLALIRPLAGATYDKQLELAQIIIGWGVLLIGLVCKMVKSHYVAKIDEVDNKIIGYATYTNHGGTGQIENLARSMGRVLNRAEGAPKRPTEKNDSSANPPERSNKPI